jgi:peroxiredoxin
MLQLDKGDTLPTITGKLADGSTFTIPDDLAARPTVLLFFRGRW